MGMNKPVIAVVGAGRMGIGIAHVFAYAGHKVELIDSKERSKTETERVLKEAAGQMENNLYFLASLELFDPSLAEKILGQIDYHSLDEMEAVLPRADVVFEAAPEILEVKKDTFDRIGASARDDAWIASTTSTFMVDTLASFLDKPKRFVNTHWLNPAYLIPLVEVSPGAQTASGVLAGMMELLSGVGKVPVQCAASPGFIVPRIQALAMNEAARLVQEGVATPEAIDTASRVGFGLRFAVLGLLEFIDWGGGDILYYADRYLEQELSTDRYAPPDIISENMANGRTGMKSGKGFYDFSGRDVTAYQRETMRKFVDLLQHLGYWSPPGEPSLRGISPSLHK
ncbi:3-hydroxybutyryl-CoA dehydrogenase [Paenibacillus sp. 7124]|uniref:L-gulonate 3-dehydrogenase n=1 Tax=Paenibacillus apii TaxID=1850370 RepID=A0A6M1PP30_9BACL|nr:3-hydroxybutyryl-CoA dehydrogenase [Paenibacillus apii]NGM83925.1 3-hydroxybutyryl-CoA dehydrogenase [Paenibacillus apii]NJJ40557.1 3-hydroxybutyryl-CoA dehydrogenase [Paenibacillus apii]